MGKTLEAVQGREFAPDNALNFILVFLVFKVGVVFKNGDARKDKSVKIKNLEDASRQVSREARGGGIFLPCG